MCLLVFAVIPFRGNPSGQVRQRNVSPVRSYVASTASISYMCLPICVSFFGRSSPTWPVSVSYFCPLFLLSVCSLTVPFFSSSRQWAESSLLHVDSLAPPRSRHNCSSASCAAHRRRIEPEKWKRVSNKGSREKGGGVAPCGPGQYLRLILGGSNISFKQ